MSSTQKPTDLNDELENFEGPALEQLDWDNLAGVEQPVSRPDNGDLRYPTGGQRKSGRLKGEDDDNPYQTSDAALPDDREEEAISDGDEATDRGAT